MVGEKIGCGQLQIVNSVIKHINRLNQKILQTTPSSNVSTTFSLLHRTC
uniref:Uncharacterized protein n=1 Tax=Meloidogyne enterolobii TaxID=390850 RepID=A0A6V7WIA3_MELEN|nr:unnamed protein product [Meloidogyne enterolobii]